MITHRYFTDWFFQRPLVHILFMKITAPFDTAEDAYRDRDLRTIFRAIFVHAMHYQ